MLACYVEELQLHHVWKIRQVHFHPGTFLFWWGQMALLHYVCRSIRVFRVRFMCCPSLACFLFIVSFHGVFGLSYWGILSVLSGPWWRIQPQHREETPAYFLTCQRKIGLKQILIFLLKATHKSWVLKVGGSGASLVVNFCLLSLVDRWGFSIAFCSFLSSFSRSPPLVFYNHDFFSHDWIASSTSLPGQRSERRTHLVWLYCTNLLAGKQDNLAHYTNKCTLFFLKLFFTHKLLWRSPNLSEEQSLVCLSSSNQSCAAAAGTL